MQIKRLLITIPIMALLCPISMNAMEKEADGLTEEESTSLECLFGAINGVYPPSIFDITQQSEKKQSKRKIFFVI